MRWGGLRRLGAAGLLAAGSLLGCFGGGWPERGAGSALWLEPESAPVDAAQLGRLEALGVRELFVQAARLEWSGAAPRFERVPLAAPARRMPTTLVISGEWASGAVEPKAVAEKLAAELATLESAAERAGLLVVGIHLDLPAPRRLEEYAAALAALRRRLDGRLLVSVDLDRKALGREQLEEVARSVDYLVCFLYGQRAGASEDPEAWDLQGVERNVRRLESLGGRYLLGVVLVGSAEWLGPAGRLRDVSTAPSLRALVAERTLELVPGFSLQGVDRQVFEFVAREPTPVGSWRLARGERVRIVKPATPFVEELLRRAGAWETPHRLGELFYRAPRAHEGMALGLGSLEAALAPQPARPRLELSVERLRHGERDWTVRLRLTNPGAEPTDLAFFDSNYAELRVRGARIGDVEPGAFRRFELLHDGREKGTMRALRDADTVRLFAPLVEGGDVLESGDIEIVLHEEHPTLTLSASFLLPEGRTLVTEAVEWSFAETAGSEGRMP